MSYIKETRETESRVRELESRIEGECEREDYIMESAPVLNLTPTSGLALG